MPDQRDVARLTPVPGLRPALRAWEQGLPAQTIECLRGRLKLEPKEWVVWLIYADALQSVARYPQATTTARQALRLAPAGRKHKCYRRLAEIAEAQGKMSTWHLSPWCRLAYSCPSDSMWMQKPFRSWCL